MLISDHCTRFFWELGFLSQRHQEQLPACEKCQGLSRAAKAQHVDSGCKQKSSLVMKEALGVAWKDNWRPSREVTQPTEQCETLLVVPTCKKLYSFLSSKHMSFFLTRHIDIIHMMSCLPLAEENEVSAEGNEVNAVAAQLCFLRWGWHPWMSKKFQPWRAASLLESP